LNAYYSIGMTEVLEEWRRCWWYCLPHSDLAQAFLDTLDNSSIWEKF
jgi:hypothetical protein